MWEEEGRNVVEEEEELKVKKDWEGNGGRKTGEGVRDNEDHSNNKATGMTREAHKVVICLII